MPLTPPAPSPVPSFSKGLIHWIEKTLIDPYRYLYTWVAGATNVIDMEWRHVMFRWQRATPTGTVEDYAIYGLNIINITNGDVDKTWTTQDYVDCEAALNEFFNATMQYVSTGHTLLDYRWYTRSFNPQVPWGQPANSIDPATGKPWVRFTKSGPPQRVTSIIGPGTNANNVLPYQVAASVTFKTPAPRHWGRVYLPGLAQTVIAGPGRFASSFTTALANQFAELVDDLAAKQFQLIVPTTQIDGKLDPDVQTVTQIVVDDIPDVQRRRRPRQAALRTVGVPLP